MRQVFPTLNTLFMFNIIDYPVLKLWEVHTKWLEQRKVEQLNCRLCTNRAMK